MEEWGLRSWEDGAAKAERREPRICGEELRKATTDMSKNTTGDTECPRGGAVWKVAAPSVHDNGFSTVRGPIRETTTLRNTWRSRWPQIAICCTLGSIAARPPSQSAFPWLMTMPPNQARSDTHAANPQAALAQHSRRYPQDCTADKLQNQYWVLGTVYWVLCIG